MAIGQTAYANALLHTVGLSACLTCLTVTNKVVLRWNWLPYLPEDLLCMSSLWSLDRVRGKVSLWD